MLKTSATTFVTLVLIALPAATVTARSQGLELPARKPGQWEIKMISMTPGAPPSMIMGACIDAATDAAMMQAGLAISKTIIEAHHGRIWATRNPVRGCAFHFTLPLE